MKKRVFQALFLDAYLEDAMAKSSGSLSFFSDFVEFFFAKYLEFFLGFLSFLVLEYFLLNVQVN